MMRTHIIDFFSAMGNSDTMIFVGTMERTKKRASDCASMAGHQPYEMRSLHFTSDSINQQLDNPTR